MKLGFKEQFLNIESLIKIKKYQRSKAKDKNVIDVLELDIKHMIEKQKLLSKIMKEVAA